MDLNLEGLNNLGKAADFKDQPKKQGCESDITPFLEINHSSTPENKENATAGEYGANSGVSILQRESDERKAEKERYKRAYSEYGKNIKASEAGRSEILKGVKNGEDLTTLFLKAAEVISLMTGDKVFYSQISADLNKP